MKTASVVIQNDVVIKSGSPDLMRIEAQKSIRAYKIAKESDLFDTPRVLDYDESAGRITFELMRDVRGMRDFISTENAASLMTAVGRILAAVHERLKLPHDMVIPLPQEYCQGGTEVFLHGDFALCNMYVNTNNSRITIIDWQIQPRKLHVNATYGSRYFDMMWLIYNLFYRPFGRKRYQMAVAAAPMAKAFLDGYFGASEFAYNHDEFQSYMRRFLANTVNARKNGLHFKRRLLLAPSHIKLRKFIKTYEFNRHKKSEKDQ